MSPQVSVIIPTYNHRDYVLQTIGSVISQTFDDYEIIVINDGSPDNTAQVLAPLAKSGRIRYIEQANAGQAAARNRGLELARGEFIAFLDDDDLWPPDKLEWQLAHLRSHAGDVAVGGGVQYVDESGEPSGEAACPATKISFESLFGGSPFVSPGQTLIRAATLRAVGGLNAQLWGVDDFDLWFRLARRGPIRVLPRLALFYRLHASNASKNTVRMFYNALDLLHNQLAHAPKARRAHLSRRAHRWLYDYAGQDAVHELRIHKLKSPCGALHNLKRLSYFALPLLSDRQLARTIWRDALPRFLAPKSQRDQKNC